MSKSNTSGKAVAIIGAGAAGAATAAAFASEDTFGTIRVFERRETAGGTWIYDADPNEPPHLYPGKLPSDVDSKLELPQGNFPAYTSPCKQYRFDRTPIYSELTGKAYVCFMGPSTNVPDIAMSFSDERFAYGPFAPHWVPKQYVQNYFSSHGIDQCLVLNTTVEDMTRIATSQSNKQKEWRLTLRRYDPIMKADCWWIETFDAVVIANGHYSVPFIPQVTGLTEYVKKFPGRVTHSKSFRSSTNYAGQSVLVIGNSASGHDITTLLARSPLPKFPIFQSRRSRSRWDGEHAPANIAWKPLIKAYDASTGAILFEDGSVLRDIDAVIYCTGYKPSFPFWNASANGGDLFDYQTNRLRGFYQHTFSTSFPLSLGIVGVPRVLTFRSFEYQAVALARVFSHRNATPLPSQAEMRVWETERAQRVEREHRPFHEILWDTGETNEWFRYLFTLSGLPLLEGKGRFPPVLDERTRWALEHITKYPDSKDSTIDTEGDDEDGWLVVERRKKDSLHFI